MAAGVGGPRVCSGSTPCSSTNLSMETGSRVLLRDLTASGIQTRPLCRRVNLQRVHTP